MDEAETTNRAVGPPASSVVSEGSDARLVGVALAKFLGLFLLVWCFCEVTYYELPYLQSGGDVVYNSKLKLLESGKLFPSDGQESDDAIIIFGNSKVLSGFQPREFDIICSSPGRKIYSYNFGLPGAYRSRLRFGDNDDENIVPDLERLAATGPLPKFVLITLSWPEEIQSSTVFHFLEPDSVYIDELFPFRNMPRDILEFLARSVVRGGVVKFYEYGRETVAEVEAERGYYFIEGQSHYAGDHLPEGFKLDTDRPDLVLSRKISPQGPNFEQLNALATKYHFQVILVPTYYRVGEFAPPPPLNTSLAEELRPYPAFRLVGPDYLLFENRYFSDPVHANRAGALLYTRRLAELLNGHVFGKQAIVTPQGRVPSEAAR